MAFFFCIFHIIFTGFSDIHAVFVILHVAEDLHRPLFSCWWRRPSDKYHFNILEASLQQALLQPCAWEHQKHFLKESHSQLTCPPSQLLCRTEHLKRIYVLDVQYWSVKTWTFLLEAASKMRKPRVRFRCLWSSLKFVPCWISSMVLYRYLVSMTSTCRTCWKTLILLGSLK